MQEKQYNKRIAEIDIAKGLCILLVVLGHGNFPAPITRFIYAFHVPFFFWVSGFMVNMSSTYTEFLVKRLKTLLVPFLIYYAIHLPLYGYIFHRSIEQQFLYEIGHKIGGALWFVPILFLASLICRAIPQRITLEIPCIFFMAAITSLLCIEGIVLPLNLGVLPLCSSYVLIGRIMGGARNEILANKSTVRHSILMISLAMITYLISCYSYQQMYHDRTEPALPIMVGAIMGSIMVLSASSIIKKSAAKLKDFLCYTGRNTFVFIAFSQPILKIENMWLKSYVIPKYMLLFGILYLLIFIKNQSSFMKKLHL